MHPPDLGLVDGEVQHAVGRAEQPLELRPDVQRLVLQPEEVVQHAVAHQTNAPAPPRRSRGGRLPGRRGRPRRRPRAAGAPGRHSRGHAQGKWGPSPAEGRRSPEPSRREPGGGSPNSSARCSQRPRLQAGSFSLGLGGRPGPSEGGCDVRGEAHAQRARGPVRGRSANVQRPRASLPLFSSGNLFMPRWRQSTRTSSKTRGRAAASGRLGADWSGRPRPRPGPALPAGRPNTQHPPAGGDPMDSSPKKTKIRN